MKVDITYTCETCGRSSQDKGKIQACEARGIPDPKEYPVVGTMFEMWHVEYVGIFAIASIQPAVFSKHCMSFSSWACRSDYRDTIGDKMVYGGLLLQKEEQFRYRQQVTTERRHTPEFQRMVQFLWSKQITPIYYDEDGWHVQYGANNLISTPPESLF